VSAGTFQLAAALKELRAANEERLRREWNRSLPFAEGLFDRWERARALGFGEGASIYDSAIVLGEVAVGAGTWVGPNVLLDGSGGGIAIGSTCSISAGVQIYTHDTVKWALSGGRLPRRTGAVAIGDCCYVGPQAVIVAGVRVGRSSVVGALSYVDAEIPELTFVAGSPARPKGRVVVEGDDVRIVPL
jgi:acetyltransferase-like isoleucine patch superfamily enzyme